MALTPTTNDPVLEWLRANELPVTRETYIAANWSSGPPVPWTKEDEAELPEELQDWSIFDDDGDDSDA